MKLVIDTTVAKPFVDEPGAANVALLTASLVQSNWTTLHMYEQKSMRAYLKRAAVNAELRGAFNY